MAAAFTACSQEELVEAPVVKDNVADRPVAGVVEFSTEGVESRFNYEKADGFELGDVFGLYLMDEFVDGNAAFENSHKAEHNNANGTYWRYQNHWFGMYDFTNSIQSNYPFTYKSEGGKKVWKNDAKLVEGNYFAMFPQNEVALNRRELWHVIDPTVELKKVSSSTSDNLKYQNVENQFWLGYKQIYRDATASAEGVMEMDLDMTGVLVPLKFKINNNSNNDVIVDKISFKNKLGKALPTLAYVRPDKENAGWNGAAYSWVKMDAANSEYISCDAKAHYLYNETKTWTKQTIQNIVEWAVPGDQNIPYGLEGAAAKPAYEYSFTYPADVTLKGNVNGGSLLTTYIAVPAMENAPEWNDLQVCVYGWQKDNSSATGWTYGMLSTKKGTDDDNYTFNLNEAVNAWSEQAEETGYYREVVVKFSEFAWKTVNQSEIAGTSDMEKMVKSYLSQNGGDITSLEIAPDADGVEVTKEFVEYLINDSKDKGRSITLKFNGVRGGMVVFNDDNTMAINEVTTETNDTVKFKYTGGIKLINNAKQTIASYAISVPVVNNGEMTVLNGGVLANVENNGEMTVGSNDANHGGNVTLIDNYGDLTLKSASNVTTINNKPGAGVIVDANHTWNCYTATVTNYNNEYADQCDGGCVPSELTVKTGTLAVTNLTNNAKMTVDAGSTVSVVTRLVNNKHGHGYAMINNGSITGKLVTNNGVIDNYGALNLEEVANNNTINGYKGSIKNLENAENGYIYIKSETIDVTTSNMSEGVIVFEGVKNQHVSQLGGDKRVFKTAAAMSTDDLFPILNTIKAYHIWTAYDITLTGASSFAETYKAISELKVNGDVKLTGSEGRTYNMENATLEVADGARLSVEDGITVKFNNRIGGGDVHVGSSSTLETVIANIDHNNPKPLPDGGEIATGSYILTADMVLTSQLTIAKGSEVYIDLNNKTLTSRKDGISYLLVNRGFLKVTNGNVVGTSGTGNNPCIANLGSAVIDCNLTSSRSNAMQSFNGSETTIWGGNFISELEKGQGLRVGEYEDAEKGTWKLYIYGGNFEGGWAGLYMANNYSAEDEENVAIIKNASFKGNKSVDDGSQEGKNYQGGDIVFDRVSNVVISDCDLKTKTIHSETERWSEINGKNLYTINPVYEYIFGY